MQRDPLELSAQDIDKIIAFQRQARARRESGIKTKRPKAATAPSGIDLVALVSGKSAPVKLAPQATTTVTNKSFRRL
jgi:hypothetical protein